MKVFLIVIASLTIAQSSDTARADNGAKSDRVSKYERRESIYLSRPRRVDEPLRYENISDIEVREIETEVARILPGAIVNISGVTTGCPCEDGPDCTDQVWILAHNPGKTTGLMLSRIHDHWTIGPLQRWWLSYDRIWKRTREVLLKSGSVRTKEYRRLLEEQQRLLDDFPTCAAEPQDDDA